MADVAAFLGGVGQWLAQVESCLATRDDSLRTEHERELVEALAPRIIAAFNSQHERFEELVCAVPPELLGVHENFVRRVLEEAVLMFSLWASNILQASRLSGDYEMMNMIHRNQPEGGSLFAKLIHFLLVSQWPARSSSQSDRSPGAGSPSRNHSRRGLEPALSHFKRRVRLGAGNTVFLPRRPAGPGPGVHAPGFQVETLNHAGGRLAEVKRQFGHHARVETRHISVYPLLRRGAQPGQGGIEIPYDLIYCAGLFDYLPDETCRALVDLFYNSLKPGGLVVVANMKDDKPFRYFIEFVLDWRLIYRNAARLGFFAPRRAVEAARVEAEETSVNLFLHVRKPA